MRSSFLPKSQYILQNANQNYQDFCPKSVTSGLRPKMKREAEVNTVFFLSKKTAFTPASLFIFGQPTDIMALVTLLVSV